MEIEYIEKPRGGAFRSKMVMCDNRSYVNQKERKASGLGEIEHKRRAGRGAAFITGPNTGMLPTPSTKARKNIAMSELLVLIDISILISYNYKKLFLRRFMKKHIFLLALLLILLVTTVAAAKSPINENIIKYRYYVKQISLYPEFEGDFVLNFEKQMSSVALENEVASATTNYKEVLNYIDCKNSNEVVIYAEFLKMLKENLAAAGVFPQKFDDIVISDEINETVFNEFSLEFNNCIDLNSSLPDVVKKTKRIYPYLSKAYFMKSNKTEAHNLFKTFLDDINKTKGDPEQDAYKQAVAYTNNAYNEYCNNNFELSAKSFENSIPYWETFYNLSGNSALVPYLKGTLKVYQGNSAVEYDFNYARQLFESAIALFPNDFNGKFSIYWANCSIAEIYYRQNDIKGFISWMQSHPAFKGSNQDAHDADAAIVLKTSVIQHEYNRLAQQPYVWNNSNNGKKDRKAITDSIKKIESNNQNTPANIYIKKFIKRYKSIMESNSLEISEVSFYSVSDDPMPSAMSTDREQLRINLKDHELNGATGVDYVLIEPPDWSVTISGNNYNVTKKKVAVVRGKILRLIVKLNFNATAPLNVNITGKSQSLSFHQIGQPNTDNRIVIESDKPVQNTVGILDNYTISWYNNNIVMDPTNHAPIYIVRQYVKELCFWQIVEYTCKWLEKLSADDLASNEKGDKNVINAIWDGCSIDNLTNLKYEYHYPYEEAKTLADLLRIKSGKCKRWAYFLKHCFYCQGIVSKMFDENNNQIISEGGSYIEFFFKENPDLPFKLMMFKYYDKKVDEDKGFEVIGKKYKIDFLPDHALVGIGGKLISGSPLYSQGEIFDIVFHIRSNSYQYEFIAVKNLIDHAKPDEIFNKDPNVKQFDMNYSKVDHE